MAAGKESSSSDSSAEESIGWRQSLSCGPNALYMYLSCHGRDVSYAEIRDAMPLADRGVTLGDMWRTADGAGLPSAAVKCDLAALRGVDLPAVVLLEAADMPYGHFTLLVEADEKSVTLIDPVSTISSVVDVGSFKRAWTGYALIAKNQSGRLPRLAWLVAGSACVLGLAGVRRPGGPGCRSGHGNLKPQDKEAGR